VAAPRSVTVLVYRPSDAAAFAALVRAPRNRVTVHVAGGPDEAAKAIGEVDVVWGWKLPPALYAKAPRLAWLEAMGAGVDWALVPELPARVIVTRAAGVFGPWMAEYTLAWCLRATQRMAAYQDAQRARVWRADLMPDRLAGKTMVIVGLGEIGRAIARVARALGMRIVGVSRSGRSVPGVSRVYRPPHLTRALAEGDFVVLVTPLTATTHGLIGQRELAAMRPSAWFVNIGRGALVDETALVSALTQKAIAGAVLDVFAVEPLPPAHALWTLDNVVVTPHIAGPDVPEELPAAFNANLARYLGGRPLRHVVDRRRGY
jgi:phosphoglycerate dehydrogenase-like enzyme